MTGTRVKWAALCALTIVLTLLCAPVAHGAIAMGDADYEQAVESYPSRIYDDLHIFNDEQVENLQTWCAMIAVEFDIDAAVHTTDTTGGLDIRDYADDFYDYHPDGLGIGSGSSGVLIVLQLGGGEGNRDFYVATTGDAIELLSDARIAQLFDYAVDDLIAGNYHNAVWQTLITIHEDAIAWTEWKNAPDPGPTPTPEPLPWWYFGPDLTWIVLSIGGGLLVGLIAVLAVRSSYKKPYKPASPDYRLHSRLDLTHNEDILIDTVITTRIIRDDPPPNHGDDSGGGSSFGGHSSTHTSSSGQTHGGGGGKF